MKKIWKIAIALFIIIILALGIGSWYLSKHWKPILNDRLQIIVSSSSDSLYSLTYDEFDFSWYSGNAYLTNVSLTPNKEVYERFKTANKAPDNQYSIQIKSVKLKNFHPKLLYQTQKLNINEILIEDPTVLIINENSLEKDSLQTKEKKTPYQQISKFLKELQIKDLNVKNLNFTYRNNSLKEQKETKLKNINIAVHDFLIDSISQKDTSRVYYSSGLDFKMDSYQIATRDSMYYINFKGIDFSTSKKRLKMNRVELKPRHSKTEFYKISEKPTDRFDIVFDSLSIQNIDIHQLLKTQRFHASKVNIKKGSLEIYNNANYKRIKTNRIGKDPHQQLQKLAWNFNLDTINILNTVIAYEELSRLTQQVGKISFNNSTIRIFNVTNDSLAISQDPIMRAYLTTKLMNASQLKANFQFNLTSPTGAFDFQGRLNAMNGRALNPVLKPLGQVEITSANIKSLAFNFKANQNEARGNVNFHYTDLKVKLLMLKQGGLISKNKLASTIANNFIINNSNPTEFGEFIQGDVHYKRPKTYSFFKFVWKSIFQGVKTSAGVSEEREAKLKNRASNTKQAVKDTKKAAKKVGSFFKGVFEKKEKE